MRHDYQDNDWTDDPKPETFAEALLAGFFMVLLGAGLALILVFIQEGLRP